MAARISRVALEVLAIPAPTARVTRVAAEVLSAVPLPQARISRIAAEVLSVRAAGGGRIVTSAIVFVAKIQVAIDASGTLAYLWATNGPGWTTGPSDTPANTHIVGALKNAGTYRRSAFSGNRVFGAVEPSWGETVLENTDGRYDAHLTSGFDGQPFSLWAVAQGAATFDAARLVYQCEVETAIVDFRSVRLKMRDRLVRLKKPILVDTYAGTGGLEGDDSIKGIAKQRVFGDPIYHPVQRVIFDPPEIRYESDGPTYDIGASYEATPTASMVMIRYRLPRALEYEADLFPSGGEAKIAATAETIFDIRLDDGTGDVSVGSITWAAAGTIPVFVLTGGVLLTAAKDTLLTVIAPATPDATLAQIAITLSGYV